MTRTGCICMIVIVLLSAGGVLFCGLKNRGNTSSGASRHLPLQGKARGQELPTVTGEPVVFRTAEMRFVTCKSSMQVGREQAEAMGFDPRRETERAQARQYWEKELAYRLADLLLEQGGIRFQLEGNIYRAELKAVLPERSGT